MTEDERMAELPVVESDRVQVIGIPTQGSAVLRVWTEAVTEGEGEEPIEASFDFLLQRPVLEALQAQITQALKEMDASVPTRPSDAIVH